MIKPDFSNFDEAGAIVCGSLISLLISAAAAAAAPAASRVFPAADDQA
jgi:hypothetical protein